MRFAPDPSLSGEHRGGRLGAPVTIVLAAALLLAYFGFQHGELTLGAARGIEFRCTAVEYGLIPYEVTHPGAQLTDPFCQPQPGTAVEAHDHPRTDPGLVADAPTWLTIATSTFMHGGLLPLGASVVFLLLLGPALERRLGAARFLGVFVLAGLVSAAVLVAAVPNLPIATVGSAGAVAGVIGAHLVLLRGALSPAVLLGAWLLLQIGVANLDAAQPVAGDGGDLAYLAQLGGLLTGLLAGVRLNPRVAPEVRTCQASARPS
jgi:membrane associated rhomboid family serine protease